MEILKQSLEHLDTGNLLGARDTDIRFLKDILENPVISSLAHLTESLDVLNSRRSDEEPAKPVFQLGLSLIYSIRSVCFRLATYNRYACELCNILDNPHILAVMDAHDHVASKSYGDDDRDIIKESDSIESDEPNEETPNAFKIVGISKKDDEPLGMTFRVENDHIVIARILCGGLVDRQGLLHVGDTILEVNGRPVSTHQQLLEQLRLSHDIVTLKIVPSFQESIASAPCYMRALYNYDPLSDTLLPCKEIGIAFKSGDILEVRNQEDPNWWQARRTDIDDPPIGLIPSQELEEKRKAFVRPEFDYATKTTICGTKVTKKKRKEMYQIQANNYFDKAELTLYEEVCRIPPFERKTLVLVGAQGVGRRTLKSKLINYDPQRFATPLPHTSRPIREGEQDGKVYHFVKKEIMEQDIADHKYLEWGQFDGHLYGTKLDSIRAINQSGRMCVLDCNPQCLKVLKTAEFMPFVVFIAAPPLDQLRFMHEWGRSHSSANRTMTLDRALGRHSRRTRTLQSLASFCEDEDLQATIEESARLQRTYEKKFDMILVNNNFERTFEDLREALEALSTEPQWVPLSWVFSE